MGSSPDLVRVRLSAIVHASAARPYMSAPLAVGGQAVATGMRSTPGAVRNLRVNAFSTGSFDAASSASETSSTDFNIRLTHTY